MSEPLAYLNGEYVPQSQARLHVFDLGVVGGVAVAEMLRTFRHKPFRVTEHLSRLVQSLRLTGLTLPVAIDDLPEIIERVVQSQTGLLQPTDDCGVIVFVTAGLNSTYVGRDAAQAGGCSLGVHTFELQIASWAEKYDRGVSLVTPPQTALPPELVDPRIKSRSRMHWHLAERAAREIDGQASALLLDRSGFITETAAANFCAVIGGAIVSPPEATVLEGVSLGMVRDLAHELGTPFVRRPITVDEALGASESFLTSTPSCLLPVVKLNGQRIGDGDPGPVYQELLRAWSAAVGTDVCLQGPLD
jgi:branched-subunit amino acid aminotransferase/4-amino-4-deoxychorismate lyase